MSTTSETSKEGRRRIPGAPHLRFNPPPGPIGETVGAIDRVASDPDGRHLRIEGWVAAIDPVEIDGFLVSVGDGPPSAPETVAYPLPSPDVSASRPTLPGAEDCRFSIGLPMPPSWPDQPLESIIAVTPTAAGRPGRMIVTIPDASLPIPGQELIDAIGVGFLDLSCAYLGYAIQQAGLRPGDRVLDAGCGCGRMAYALAYYLDPSGGYEGFDIVDELIEWARQNITPRRPNFRFRRVDLHSKRYNPGGSLLPETFRFPYDESSFDYALLTSVFTHMFLGDVGHYLAELRRVLKPGGRCLFTCFLMNEESRRLIREGRSALPIVHPVGHSYTTNPEVPEDAIGLDERELLRILDGLGFEVAERYEGSWCGRPRPAFFQDRFLVVSPP
jgi:SAM-dependent methyltransferase